MIARWSVVVVLLACAAVAHAEEIKPGVLRTPEARFVDLEGFPFDAHYLEIDGMRVHYLDEGPGDGEPILLIHGEPTWSYLFRKMIPILVGAGYRVVAPDLVGFGKSDKYAEEAAYSYAMQVAFMRELVVRLDLRDATFFGQDWGGLIGLRVVAAEPDRFARIVVSNTALPSASGLGGAMGYPFFKALVWWLAPVTLDELRADLSFPRWVAYSQHVEDLPVGDVMALLGGPQQPRAGYEAPFPDQRYKAAAHIMPYLVLSELRENEVAWETVFDKWDKPFLVAFGDADPITAAGEAIFLERVPTAQNVTIRGAGHFVQEDAGPELARLMIDFMQGRPLPAEVSVDRK
ncbi:MAG: haloalkane dehalogenase [Deltaproteobacteria bacterium]|nr:haloalkane dehalogenase [Deltaproteobacteria bacterium]